MPLYDRDTGTVSDRYTTREVREQERAAMAAAAGLSRQKAGAVSAPSAKTAMGRGHSVLTSPRRSSTRSAPAYQADRGSGRRRQKLYARAVGAFDKAGAITWTDKQDEARSGLWQPGSEMPTSGRDKAGLCSLTPTGTGTP